MRATEGHRALGPQIHQNFAGRMIHHCKDAENVPHKCMNQVQVTWHSNRALLRGRPTSREGRGRKYLKHKHLQQKITVNTDSI